jgi:hypothetical protein
VCLVLGSEELRTLMADDIDLIQGMFRIASGGDRVAPSDWVSRAGPGVAGPVSDLTPVEKILLFSNNPFFAGVAAEEIRSLVSIASEVRLREGAVLSAETDPPCLFAVASGEIALSAQSDDPAHIAGPNDAAGIRHTLTGCCPGRRVSVLSEGIALRIDREDLFELLAQRPDLLRKVLGAASRFWTATQAASA